MKNVGIIFLSIVLGIPAFAQIQQFDVAFPSPVAFYDFDGDGEKRQIAIL